MASRFKTVGAFAVFAALVACLLFAGASLTSYDGPSYVGAQDGSPVAVETLTPDIGSPVPSVIATATATPDDGEPTIEPTIPEETNTPVVCEDELFIDGVCTTPTPVSTATATATATPCPSETATATAIPDDGEPTVTSDEDEIQSIVAMPDTGAGTTAREVVQSNHTYTTAGPIYCWKFMAGIYYARQNFYVYYDNPFGGHYLAYSYLTHYPGSRCLPA